MYDIAKNKNSPDHDNCLTCQNFNRWKYAHKIASPASSRAKRSCKFLPVVAKWRSRPRGPAPGGVDPVQNLKIQTSTCDIPIFVVVSFHDPKTNYRRITRISQTLAGRTAVLTLLPFSLSELKNYKSEWDPFDIISQGAYPRIHGRDDYTLKETQIFNPMIHGFSSLVS